MRDFRDAKLMAKELRSALAEHKINLNHSTCLDLVARQFGLKDWNILSAKIEAIPSNSPHAFLQLPEGWIKTGSAPQLYEAGVVPNLLHDGKSVVTIQFIGGAVENDTSATLERVDGFATVMQSVSAQNYRGKSLRFEADLRSIDVIGSATIWLRADDASGRLVEFSNLESLAKNGSLKGSTDWCSRQITLKIPEASETVNFGFYLNGTGQAWFSGLSLKIVDDSAVSTPSQFLTEPLNLDFKQT